ncbi:restriction endonuclease [Streptomyces sp. NPDC005794]|uniref:restriction endonuclease n=1 Tax=Streptomyces sp. NPDC005794 TaxID=3364733 RepID=UPI00369D26AA
MVQYLSTDPEWTEQFTRVWMWSDWPGTEHDKRDTGIDLVAQDRETGGFCAIQCKFYEPQHTVHKEDIDSFFTASGKGAFTRRSGTSHPRLTERADRYLAGLVGPADGDLQV